MTAAFGALQDIRVLDLTRMLAGPYGTMMLADHGADVIKIEAPSGDITRPSGPFYSDDEERTHGGYFQSVNRNKKSVVLDLKTPEGKEAFQKLVEGADVVVENFRVGVMDRLGLGFDTLRKINPRLVYGCLTGFGSPTTGRSPYAEWPAFDVVAQAMGGIMGVTGPDADTPTKIGPGVGDIVPGMFLAFGLLAAVHQARRTGQGQFVDVSMLDAVLAICERSLYQYTIEGKAPKPEGNHQPFIVPFGIFPAKDGYAAIATPSDEFFAILCTQLECPEMLEDSRFHIRARRSENREALIEVLSAQTRMFTKSEMQSRLGGRIPFGPMLTTEEIAHEPHFKAREMVVEIEAPGVSRPMRIAGIPVKMTETPGRIARRAPYLGEDSESVLRQVGLDEAKVRALLG